MSQDESERLQLEVTLYTAVPPSSPPHPPSANTKVKLEDEAVLNYFNGLELGL